MSARLKESVDRALGAVRDVMQRKVIAVSPDARLGEAAMELEGAEVTGAPVVRDGRVVGMVSLTDLFRAAGVPVGIARTSGPWHRYEHVMSHSGKTVADAMTHRVATIDPEASVAEAAALMRERNVNRIPVVNAAGELCGIVAREDVVAAVAATIHRIHEGAHPGGSSMEADC